MTTLARRERIALCDTVSPLGGAEPTLCGRWTTSDLLAHLIIREGHPASVGNALSLVTPWTARVQRALSRKPISELVERFRAGPPRWSPMALPRVDELVNTLEFFVHHEDVRRAQEGWQPRDLTEHDLQELWAASARRAKLLLRRAAVPVSLQWPGHHELLVPTSARGAGDTVRVVGDPAELTMYLHGRRSHASVEIHGDSDSVQALADTNLAV